MQKSSDHTTDNVVKVDFKSQKTKKAKNDGQECLNEKKRELFERWLSEGMVCLLFDARHEDVKVPQEFKNRGDLRLNFCYNFHIPDFNRNEVSVWGTLSFDSGDYFCRVPWERVYGLQSAKLNQGAVWFENFPKDYDQIEVLGFSEEMCVGFAKTKNENSQVISMPLTNVVELDFYGK